MNKDVVTNNWDSYIPNDIKPEDFDEFWKRGREEVDLLDKKYEWIEHTIYSSVAKGYDMYFSGVNGARIHAQIVKPVVINEKLPVLFQFHGYHVDSGDWTEKIANAAEGIMTVVLDVRGQGGESEDNTVSQGGTIKGHIIRGIEDGPQNLLFRNVFLDVYQLIQIIISMKDVDVNKLFAYGASQGGALALIAAYFEPRIKKVFTLYPFLSIYREAYTLDVSNSAYEELAYWFRFRDPLHTYEKDFFKTLDYIDLQFFAPEVQADIVWGIGLEDRICHPKLQMGVFNKLICKKEMLVFPEYEHEHIPKFADYMRKHLFIDLGDGL